MCGVGVWLCHIIFQSCRESLKIGCLFTKSCSCSSVVKVYFVGALFSLPNNNFAVRGITLLEEISVF